MHKRNIRNWFLARRKFFRSLELKLLHIIIWGDSSRGIRKAIYPIFEGIAVFLKEEKPEASLRFYISLLSKFHSAERNHQFFLPNEILKEDYCIGYF